MALTLMGTTKNGTAVYLLSISGESTIKAGNFNGSILFETDEGDTSVAIIKGGKVVDLDGCYCLSVSACEWLTAHGIDATGAR